MSEFLKNKGPIALVVIEAIALLGLWALRNPNLPWQIHAIAMVATPIGFVGLVPFAFSNPREWWN